MIQTPIPAKIAMTSRPWSVMPVQPSAPTSQISFNSGRHIGANIHTIAATPAATINAVSLFTRAPFTSP